MKDFEKKVKTVSMISPI